jgi:hypothetical protein
MVRGVDAVVLRRKDGLSGEDQEFNRLFHSEVITSMVEFAHCIIDSGHIPYRGNRRVIKTMYMETTLAHHLKYQGNGLEG